MKTGNSTMCIDLEIEAKRRIGRREYWWLDAEPHSEIEATDVTETWLLVCESQKLQAPLVG